MNREIKFRAWDGHKMRYFDLSDTIAPSQIDIMQYTGLKDRDGNEIYEGDVISYVYQDTCEETGEGSCSGIVLFENGCFVVKQSGFDYEKAKEQPFKLHTWLVDDPCFIIGNIHDNPKLLGVEP